MPLSMKKLIPLALLGILIVGCGNKQQQTSATNVANPPEPVANPAATAPAAPAATTPGPITPPSPIVSKAKDGWVTLKSGLKYKDIKVGKGPEVTSFTKVTVQYKGWLDNGTVFDSSRGLGREPFKFQVDQDQVIQGWHEGLKGMKVGGERELNIPPALGYAEQDMGKIPPNSTLHFDIELLDAQK